jgi:hypothetical protein
MKPTKMKYKWLYHINMTNLNISFPQEVHITGVHKFPKIHKPPSHYGYQKSKVKFQLKTHNSEVNDEPRNYLVLSVHCMWTHTFQKVKKNYNNFVENILQHCTNFSFLGSQALGICTPLLYDNEEALNYT